MSADASLTEEENFTSDAVRGTLIGVPVFIYCGDNLEILRIEDYVRPESVDLIYLDPPFNSQRTYNVNYPGSRAQEEAFKDCWDWNESAPTYESLVIRCEAPLRVRNILRSFHDHLIDEDSDLLAYITMMSARLIELHRVLKPTGSMYLHCDPTASHYLKIALDAIFGSGSFKNEVVWKRSSAHNSCRFHSPVHDVLLMYAKGKDWTWNPVASRLPQKTIDEWYNNIEEDTGRRFNRADLTGSGIRGGDSGKPWKGIDPTAKGRHWAIPRSIEVVKEIVGDLPTLEALDALDEANRIYWPGKDGGVPMFKRYIEEAVGVPALDVITSIRHLHNKSPERMGYDTQKPKELLKHLLELSSNPGDIILDPFCGCGTTIEAAEDLGRRWIGIDIARRAVEVIERRFERAAKEKPPVIWHPATEQEAEALAERDPDQFEKWALRRVGAARIRAYDRGIDGEASFKNGKSGMVLVSVKGGKSVQPTAMRDLCWVVEREAKRGVSTIGVLVCKQAPSDGLRHEATLLQFLSESDSFGPIPRVQILTIADLFSGKTVRVPGKLVTPEATQATPAAQLLLPLAKTRPPPPAKKKKPA